MCVLLFGVLIATNSVNNKVFLCYGMALDYVFGWGEKHRRIVIFDVSISISSRTRESVKITRTFGLWKIGKKHESDSVIRSRSLNTDGDNTLFGLTWAEGPGL